MSLVEVAYPKPKTKSNPVATPLSYDREPDLVPLIPAKGAYGSFTLVLIEVRVTLLPKTASM